MYARNPDQRIVTLGVSGMLWNRSLVMYDVETRSYWSHLLGRAMSGPRRNTDLEQIPSTMTDWGAWKRRYPNTRVLWLPRSSRQYRRGFYQAPEQFVLGLAGVNPPRAWEFTQLSRHPVVNDQIDSKRVVAVFDPDTVTARLYSSELRGKILEFERDAKGFLDVQTRSLWDRITGECIAGQYKGAKLVPMPAIVSYRNTWLTFHPKTDFGSPR